MDKNFSDFIGKLTPDKIEAIVNNAQESLENSREDFLENPKTSLGNQVTTISLFISLGLLEEYHDWIRE